MGPALVLLLLVGQPLDSSLAAPDWPLTQEDLALLELVEQLLAAPVDVRYASPAELMEVPGMNEQLALSVTALRCRQMSLDSLLASAGVASPAAAMLKVGDRAKPRLLRCWLRWRSDTVPVSFLHASRSIRLEAGSRVLKGVLLAESDRHEQGFPDWWGGGVSWQQGSTRAVLGDFVAGLGQGLVLAAPHAASALTVEGSEAGVISLPRYALESRGLRGIGLERGAGAWRLALLGSAKRRDARLNADGTVARLVLTDLHTDSARMAEKDRVTEQAIALAGRWRRSGLIAGAVLCGQRYSRWLCPADSGYSFAGRGLAQLGLVAALQLRQDRAVLELARSSGGGNAAALEVMARAGAATASARVRTYGARFFAPLGRRPSLSDRRNRTEADARLRVRLLGLELGAAANSYCDYQEDSLPASVRLTAGYARARFRLSLAVGRRFRLTVGQSRTADLLFCFPLGRERLEFRLGDEYSDTRAGRGLMCAGILSSRRGLLDVNLLVAGFSILGRGVRMSVSEPGPGRTRTTYSTGRSGWRLALGLGCRLVRTGRLGIRAGWELAERAQPSLAGDLQFGVGDD